MSKVNQFLGERAGKSLCAEIHKDMNGYKIQFYIDDNLVKEETFYDHSIHYVEDAAENWISGIKVLNG
jgi:hypothetical protein